MCYQHKQQIIRKKTEWITVLRPFKTEKKSRNPVAEFRGLRNSKRRGYLGGNVPKVNDED